MASPQGPGQPPAGWYADPSGSGQQRYWDGAGWTEQHSEAGGAPASGRARDGTVDQVRYSSVSGVEYVAVFDGSVLEIFGGDRYGTSQLWETMRFHRDLTRIVIKEPDRKGNLDVEIYVVGASPRWVGAQCQVTITDQDRPVIDFFERVRAALPAT